MKLSNRVLTLLGILGAEASLLAVAVALGAQGIAAGIGAGLTFTAGYVAAKVERETR